MNEELTTEEGALLDALDAMPGRVIALVRGRLSGVVRTTKTRRNLDAALDRLMEELETDEIEVIEARDEPRLRHIESRLR